MKSSLIQFVVPARRTIKALKADVVSAARHRQHDHLRAALLPCASSARRRPAGGRGAGLERWLVHGDFLQRAEWLRPGDDGHARPAESRPLCVLARAPARMWRTDSASTQAGQAAMAGTQHRVFVKFELIMSAPLDSGWRLGVPGH